MKRKITDHAAVSAYLGMLEAARGKKQVRPMRQVFTRMPWESEEDARLRLALERGDFRTPTERAEDGEADTLRNLRQNSNNPNL